MFHFFNCNVIVRKEEIENLERIGLILHQRYIGSGIYLLNLFINRRVYIIIVFTFCEMIRYLWDLLDQRIWSDSRETHPVFITLLFPLLASRNSEWGRKKNDVTKMKGLRGLVD